MSKPIKYSKDDIIKIHENIIETGYDDEKDAKEMGQNFHAGDDTAYAFVNLSDLSDDAKNSILNQHEVREHLPKGFDPDKIKIKFKWNVEWGDWSDIIYDEEKVWDFTSDLNSMIDHNKNIGEKIVGKAKLDEIYQETKYKNAAIEAFELSDWITGNDTGGVEAPRIYKDYHTNEYNQEDKKDGYEVSIHYTYPETSGLSDCRYHNTEEGKEHIDAYKFSDDKMTLNGKEDIFGIKNFVSDLYIDKVNKFYDDYNLKRPDFLCQKEYYDKHNLKHPDFLSEKKDIKLGNNIKKFMKDDSNKKENNEPSFD